jgi:hypothetical protein
VLFAADKTDKNPGMGMDHAPARRVGVALACPLTGHKSKGHAKGVYGLKVLCFNKSDMKQQDRHKQSMTDNVHRLEGVANFLYSLNIIF